LKFSTSPSAFGLFEIINVVAAIMKIIGIESFTENRGLNFTLSIFVFVFVGLEDPFSCSRIR
jgi:hypothetical protein